MAERKHKFQDIVVIIKYIQWKKLPIETCTWMLVPTYLTSECGSSTCNALSLSEILSLRRCIEKQKVGELKAYKQDFNDS